MASQQSGGSPGAAAGGGGGGSSAATPPSSAASEQMAADAEFHTADSLKDAGNEFFKAGKFLQAVDLYTRALALGPRTPALFCNRAAAHLKLENYGTALADAEGALELDRLFTKAYYRRGCVYMALQKLHPAARDFRALHKADPANKDVARQLAECERLIKAKVSEAFSREGGGGGEEGEGSSGGGGGGSGSAPGGGGRTPSPITYDPTCVPMPADYRGAVLPRVPAAGGGASAAECAADPTAVNAHGLSLAFVRALKADFKSQRLVAKRYAQELLVRLRALLVTYKSLVQAPFPDSVPHFNVCGDTHGQYYDTCNIFDAVAGEPSPTNPCAWRALGAARAHARALLPSLYGLPSFAHTLFFHQAARPPLPTPHPPPPPPPPADLFNGDFCDRGSWGVENVLLLFAWKLLYPEHVHLTRGNHETKLQNKVYGFEGEVVHKYDARTMELFTLAFQALPLACIISGAGGEGRVMVTHGGLFTQDGVTLENIEGIHRYREPGEEGGWMSDLLWSDPQPFPGRSPSKRGVGQSFGPDVTERFLAANDLCLLIRSHEVKDEGYVVEHEGRCITVFSAPNYCDTIGNKGAVCRLTHGALARPTFLQFTAVPHPPIRPSAWWLGGGLQSSPRTRHTDRLTHLPLPPHHTPRSQWRTPRALRACLAFSIQCPT
jgi:serine/threonine-protein phosphatase 5